MNLKLEKLYKINDNTKLKGVASVIIDDCFKVTDIKIIEGENGLFLAMPTKQLKNGDRIDLVHPINQETRELFNKVIFDAYNEE